MSSKNNLTSGLSGRDHYAKKFSDDLDFESEWLRRTASPKADSIEYLVDESDAKHDSIIEIGAGTGAVIGELRRRGFGSRHYAVDYSEEAIEVIRRTHPGVMTAIADVTDNPDPFGEGPYDIAFASHVVEHLEAPQLFLERLLDIPVSYLIVEVPLEDLFFGKIKSKINDRSQHPAGHVQFFSKSSFMNLVRQSGWTVESERIYLDPLDVDSFNFIYGNSSAKKRAFKTMTERVLPYALNRIWIKMYHAHCAVLCSRSQ